MSRNKNLFLFAGYDQDGIVDDAILYYVSALSQHGDVIAYVDCDCKKSEIDKLKPYTLFADAKKHGEYDFGSYKRAFQYAYDKDLLKKYDYIYLVNDSVFGPLYDIQKTLNKIESNKSDAVSMVLSKHKTHSFMESWFVCLNKKIATSKWFYDFITSVQQEEHKYIITVKYEHGLTNIIKNNGCTFDGLFVCHGRFTYNNPKYLFKHGCPFVKKASFTRHNGDLGNQIKYILNHCDKKAGECIMKTANRVYGHEYMNKFLTYNPIKIFIRKISYVYKKIKNGEL